MENSKENRYTLEESKRTEEATDTYEIRWIIPMFLKLMKTEVLSGEFRTPKMTMVELPKSKFQLKMCFFGRENHCNVYYLSSTSMFLKLNLDITWGKFSKKISRDYRTIQANKWIQCLSLSGSETYENSSITITFKFEVDRDVKVDCYNIPTPQLCDDFRNLFTDSICSDVILKSAEGVEFKVHKPVISIRSKVLRAHFEHNTKETQTNIVETTWTTSVLRELLTFVYTDKAHIDDDPEELLAAADYYQLQGLKSLCEEALCKRLTVENAIDTLQLAELHSAHSLRETTLEYIKHGRARMIIDTQGWANVKSVELIKKIYEFVMANEIDYFDILASALKEVENQNKKE